MKLKLNERVMLAILFVTLTIFALYGCGEAEYAYNATVTVDMTDLLDNSGMISTDKLALVPDGGLLLDDFEVGFDEGENASAVIIRALKENKLQYQIDSPDTSPYISGIGNIYAADAGDLSGWLVYDKSELLPVGIGEYLPQDGACLRIVYVCDYMKALGFE